jgi:A/G-specific adenine glycosylase
MLLQGFPQSYELLGNLSQQVTQISDAVPPPLSKAIAIAILATIYEPREKIQKLLLDWFKTNQRHFPWRETSNPYFILVAEKLLQQTLANDNVVNAYQKIITTYPDLFSLAKAKTADICPIFEPLGFIYRAKEFPDNLKDLKSIPGVGDYIARAVLCFGFGQASPIVDTNVARFLYRVFGIYDPLPTNPARNQRLITLANNLIPQKNIKEFNLAILDLCAKVCTPNNPNCLVCPIQKICEYGRSK